MFFSISLAIFIFISENNKGASTPTSIYFLKSTTELLEQYVKFVHWHIVLISLLLTLKRFDTLFLCFYCLIWKCKYWLGVHLIFWRLHCLLLIDCRISSSVKYFTRSYKSLVFLQGKWDVPLPKVKAIGEDEVFRVVKTGKSKRMFSGFSHQFFVHPIM